MTGLTLYELIKQKPKESGRPLKIICDWDETFQVLKSAVIYEFLQEPKKDFAEFHKEFWENVDMFSASIGSKINAYHRSNEVKKAIEKQQKTLIASRDWNQKKGEENKKIDNFYTSPRRFKVPLLSTCDELCKAYKEGLIEKFVVISSYENTGNGIDLVGKRKKARKTFGKFPQTEISLTHVKKRFQWSFYSPLPRSN